MTNIRQLLQNKGSDVWSVSPDSSIFDALTLMAEKISVLCWSSIPRSSWAYSLKEIMPRRWFCRGNHLAGRWLEKL